ncbi:MAG: ParB/RepB/Spo0J family partition protein [Lachnospiraceae bacterium]
MVVKEILNIGVDHIHPHPDNPRKNIGDVSELVESIKKNGVMQNLTVIPGHALINEEWLELVEKYKSAPDEETRQKMNSRWNDEGYTLIIGHRRHAAAQLAGITELPCRIVEGLSQKEQVSTMLEENMQRNDLTIYEQAQGFQLMLDLGETEATIAEKTGFSKTTIRHRINIAKLNPKELQKKEQDDSFQLTLKDLYALEQVEDVKTRNKILKEARSSQDIASRAVFAAAEAKRDKRAKQIIKMLKPLGVEKAPENAKNEQYHGKWETVKDFDLDKDVPKQIKLKDSDTLYYLQWYRSLRVIKKYKKGKKVETPYEAQQKQRDRDKRKIKAQLKAMDADRKEFIQNIITGKIDPVKKENDVREKIWKVLFEAQAGLWPSSMRRFFTAKDNYSCTEEERTAAQSQVDSLSFTHSMLVMMHHAIADIGDIYDWQGKYKSETGKALIHAYEVLEPYGWSFAREDDEQLLDGTHELYAISER